MVYVKGGFVHLRLQMLAQQKNSLAGPGFKNIILQKKKFYKTALLATSKTTKKLMIIYKKKIWYTILLVLGIN